MTAADRLLRTAADKAADNWGQQQTAVDSCRQLLLAAEAEETITAVAPVYSIFSLQQYNNSASYYTCNMTFEVKLASKFEVNCVTSFELPAMLSPIVV